jgi:hypothetical protein
MNRNAIPLLGLMLASLLQVSPVPLSALYLQTSGLEYVPVPLQTAPLVDMISADFKGDGTPETVRISQEAAAILLDGEPVWQSPSTWQVKQGQITDLNHDGLPELTLLVWRPFRPWPVDRWLPNGGRIADFHDAEGQSCHIIMIGWMPDGYREVWAGSAMAEPVNSFAAADFNGDGNQELAVLEGSYATPAALVSHLLKVWEWNGFGFTVVSKMKGSFTKMTPVSAIDGRVLLFIP